MILEAITCLALNIYWEARNQSFIAQVAVAEVTMNRVYDDRFPDTVCGVVKQGETYKWNPNIMVRNRCQFSWYCDGLSDEVPEYDKEAWEQAMGISYGVFKNDIEPFLEGATHYHSYTVMPDWASTKTYVTRIEDHIFYRWEYGQ
jgi:spore germination cell wall hydrolase CwlJ-like protein